MVEDADKAPLEGFLERFWKDRAAGCVRELLFYLEMFPGDPKAIAREYLRCADAAGSTGQLAREDTLGPYELEEEIGRGGQGVVYRARDTRIGRTVALKVLRGLGAGADELLLRFKREAQAAGRLDHPGICAVYDTGVESGISYIAMRYVQGETLARKIATTREQHEGPTTVVTDEFDSSGDTQPEDRSPTPGALRRRGEIMRVVRLVEKAARALHAAHEAGVIHRDVKPANVMITPEGETVVMDFGLARDDQADAQTLTRSGDLFGTPAYMSPEQLTRHSIRLDRRTDVWSLGVTLYESVTLERPFGAPTREALYQQILSKEPWDPRTLNPGIPRDLAVAIMTALQKDRDRRYQTALDLAEDLRRLQAYEPIRARAIAPWERLLRWVRRRPTAAALLALLVIGATLGILAAIRFRRLALDEGAARSQADAARRDLEQQGRRTLSRLLATHARRLANTDADLALALVAEGMRIADAEPSRSAALEIIADCESRPVMARGTRPRWLKLSPAGEILAIGAEDGIRFLDTSTRESIRLYKPQDTSSTRCLFSSDASLFAYVEQEPPSGHAPSKCRIHILDPRSSKKAVILEGHNNPVVALDFSPDGSCLATGEWGPTGLARLTHAIRIWDTTTGDCVSTVLDQNQVILSVCFMADDALASVDLDGYARVWNLSSGVHAGRTGRIDATLLRRVITDPYSPNDSDPMATGIAGAVLFDARADQIVTAAGELWRRSPTGYERTVLCSGGLSVIGSMDGRFCAIAPIAEGHLARREYRLGESCAVYDLQEHRLTCLIQVGSDAHHIALGDPGDPHPAVGALPPFPAGLRAIVSVDNAGMVDVWDARSGGHRARWRGPGTGQMGSAVIHAPIISTLSNDARVAALVDADGDVRCWRIGQAPVVVRLPSLLRVVIPTASNRMFQHDLHNLYRIDPRSGGLERVFGSDVDWSIGGLSTDRSGKTVAIKLSRRGQPDKVILQSVDTGIVIKTCDLGSHPQYPNGCAREVLLSPDATKLAVLSDGDDRWTMLEVSGDQVSKALQDFGPSKPLEVVRFSPGGTRMVFEGPGYRILDVATGREVASNPDSLLLPSVCCDIGLAVPASLPQAQIDVHVVDLQSGQSVCAITHDREPAYSRAHTTMFNDGPTITNMAAIGSHLVAIPTVDGDVLVFDCRTGCLIHDLRGDPYVANAITMSADERLLAVQTEVSIQVWSLETATLFARIPVPIGAVNGAVFCDDFLLVNSTSTTSCAFPLDPLGTLTKLGVRELTASERERFGIPTAPH